MTSCFVYKVTGLTFYGRINTQLIYRFELAQLVARRITKPQRFFLGSILTDCSFLFIFFYSFFLNFIFGGGGGCPNLLSRHVLIFVYYFASISEFTVVCVVTDVSFMCRIHIKGIKNNIKNNKKKIRHEENNKISPPLHPPENKNKNN